MIEQDSILFGKTQIDYDVVYSPRRRNATLAVYPLKQVEITVPTTIQQEKIKTLVERKAVWVIKQLVWFDQITQIDSVKEYVNGESFLYLGRQYRLKLNKENGKTEVRMRGKELEVTLKKQDTKQDTKTLIKVAIWHWYREQALKNIDESVSCYSKKLGIKKPKITIKNQYKRWGSCTSKNVVIFNFRIAMAPVSQLNYVVAHELVHIKHKDHSPKFWKKLNSIMPDYQDRKEKLKQDGWQYEI